MSPEPDNKTKSLLRAYAEKRRAQAGDIQLHGATRELFRAEVRRQYPQGSPGARKSWFERFINGWPRLALASAIVMAIGVGLWSVQDRSEFQLARRETETDTLRRTEFAQRAGDEASEERERSVALKAKSNRDLALESMPPAAPIDRGAKLEDTATTRESLSFYTKETKDVKDALQLGTVPQAPRPSVARNEPSPAAGAAVASGPSADKVATASKPGETPVRRIAPADQPALLPGGMQASQTRERKLSEPASRGPQNYFRNVAMTEVESPARQLNRPQATSAPKLAKEAALGSSVLSSFQVEQSGGSVRIVDADGSVYEGRIAGAGGGTATENAPLNDRQGLAVIQPTAQPETRSDVTQQAGVRPDQKAQTSSQSASGYDVGFEVFGTNRSLKKTVSLTGSLVLASNQVPVLSVPQAQGAGGATPLQNQTQFKIAEKNATAANSATANSAAANQQVLRVIGRAKLGETNELLIDAVPEVR